MLLHFAEKAYTDFIRIAEIYIFSFLLKAAVKNITDFITLPSYTYSKIRIIREGGCMMKGKQRTVAIIVLAVVFVICGALMLRQAVDYRNAEQSNAQALELAKLPSEFRKF